MSTKLLLIEYNQFHSQFNSVLLKNLQKQYNIPFHNLVQTVLVESTDLILIFYAAIVVKHVCVMFLWYPIVEEFVVQMLVNLDY